MNNTEQAKMTRNAGMSTFLAVPANASIYAGNAAFTTLATKFTADNANANKYAAEASTDNTGFNADKLAAKKTMGETASTLSGIGQVYFESVNDHTTTQMLHSAETYFTDPADGEAAARAQDAHDILAGKITELAPDYMVAADLTALQGEIDKFIKTQGSSDAVHVSSPVATKNFKNAIRSTDQDAKNFPKLGKKYMTSNSTFYNALVEVCKIPAINVHHTMLGVALHDKTTGAAITTAQGVLSRGNKTEQADEAGVLHYEHVGAGQAMLTVTAKDYITLVLVVHIESGKDNELTLLMEKS